MRAGYSINLLPWREFERARRARAMAGAMAGAVLAGVLLVVASGWYFEGRIEAQERSNRLLEREAAVLERRIGEARAWQARKRELLERMDTIARLDNSRPGTARVFDALAGTLVDGIHYRRVERRGQSMEVEGFAASNGLVSELMRNLERSPQFTSARLRRLRKDPAGDAYGPQGSVFEMTVQQAPVTPDPGNGQAASGSGLVWNEFLAEQRVRMRRFPFGAVATSSSGTRGDGTSSNAPKGKPRIRTLSRNPWLFLAGRRPGAPGSGLAWNKFLTEQRVRIRRFSFGAVATLSSRTRGDGTSSNAPKGKPRIRTLSRNPWLFLAGRRPGAPGSGLAWNKFLTEQRVRIRRFSFGAVATLSSRTRGDGTSSNAPKEKPRMRTLSHNPRLFLAGHRPGARGSGLAWNGIQSGAPNSPDRLPFRSAHRKWGRTPPGVNG